MKKLKYFVKSLLPLSEENRKNLKFLSLYLNEYNLNNANKLLKKGLAGVYTKSFRTSFKFKSYPQMTPLSSDIRINSIIRNINKMLFYHAEKAAFKEFAMDAPKKITSLITRNLDGLENTAGVVSLILFTKKPLNMLIVGDDGVGKSLLLKSVKEIAPKAVLGLGSGFSGTRLIDSLKGKKFTKGLLASADKGICCIDELETLTKTNKNYLLKAMREGFFFHGSGKNRERLNSRIRVLATAKPKVGRFIGKNVKLVKGQLPFEEKFISNFHLLIIIKKNLLKNNEKTKQFLKYKVEDLIFVRDYIDYAEGLSIQFPKPLREEIVDFVESLKDRKDVLLPVTPILVKGIIRLCEASARRELRTVVRGKDLDFVLKIYEQDLFFN